MVQRNKIIAVVLVCNQVAAVHYQSVKGKKTGRLSLYTNPTSQMTFLSLPLHLILLKSG